MATPSAGGQGTPEGRPTNTILVVEDDSSLWDFLTHCCADEPWSLHFVGSGEEGLAWYAQQPQTLDLAIIDIGLPGISGITVLEHLHRVDPGLPVLIMTARTDMETVVECMRAGAYDYLAKPFLPAVLQHRIRAALGHGSLFRRCAFFESDDCLAEQMGPSAAVRHLATSIRQVAPTNMSVLIEGESGTGKELVARRVHALSLRQMGPFVAVDCGAIPEALLEGELFGFRKGSFTGAISDRQGKFLASQNGSLFLDEIGNLPLSMQAKLLRALQQKEVTPIGTDRPVMVDTRIVCATNCDLGGKVAAGDFRLDLYHRLAEFPISIPPLRERVEDLLYLCARALQEANREFGKAVSGFSEGAIHQVLCHPWPGNARELQSVIRRAALVSETRIDRLPMGDLPLEHTTRVSRTEARDCVVIHAQAVILRAEIEQGSVPYKQILKHLVHDIERRIVESVLQEVGGNVSRAARILGLDYKTVHSKAKHTEIRRRQTHEKARIT